MAESSPYLALLGAQIRSQTTYRLSFALDLLFSTAIIAVEIVVVLLLFTVNPTFGGFRLADGLVIAGFAMLAFTLADLVVGNIEDLPRFIRTGLLDAVLVRPLGLLTQLFVLDFDLRRIGRVFCAAALLGAGLARADIAWTPGKVLLTVAAPIAGAVTFSCIFVIGATMTFWLIDSGQVAHSFTYGGREFTTYPSAIFGDAVRWVFAYGLGLATVAYLPALALLDRSDPAGVPDWLRWCSPLAALAWVALARVCWKFGVRHYRSTGS